MLNCRGALDAYIIKPWYRRIDWNFWLVLVATFTYRFTVMACIAYVVAHFVAKYW